MLHIAAIYVGHLIKGLIWQSALGLYLLKQTICPYVMDKHLFTLSTNPVFSHTKFT